MTPWLLVGFVLLLGAVACGVVGYALARIVSDYESEVER